MRLLIILLAQLARGSPSSRCTPIEHSCSLESDGVVFHVKARRVHMNHFIYELLQSIFILSICQLGLVDF